MAFTNQYLIDFFKQRMVELYDCNTLDSYSVRTCNSMSMFWELKEMLGGWIAGNVKRGETVALCLEECLKLLERDKWLSYSFFDEKKFKAKLEEYQKEVNSIKDAKDKKEKDNHEARFMLHLVDSCISTNETCYLTSLLNSVCTDLLTEKDYDDNDFIKTIKTLDDKLLLLATELLRRGYSQSYLYFFFKSIKKNEDGIPFNEAYNQLTTKLGAVYQYQDDVIIRMNFQNDDVPTMESMVDEVPAEYMNVMRGSLTGIFKKAPGRRFYIVTVNAADTNAALQKARLCLSQALDRNDMGVVHISNRGVVSYIKDGGRTLRPEMYYNVACRRRDEVNQLPVLMNGIDKSVAISHEIKDRLNTALRHLRVGDDQAEIEQKFLNYWIGLEFLFATPRSGDSTFARLMGKFPQIKTLYYLKRNVYDLDARLKEKGLLDAEKSFGCLSEAEMNEIFDTTDDILLKYRIKTMKSHLHSRENVGNYLKAHIRNLEWHLSRIYHLRNELVHEAAIKQSIESVTTNLRSYLVFMLNLLLDYCKLQLQTPQANPVAMDNFFWHCELLWKKCTPEYQKEAFLALEVPEKLVR